ncbi:unnamed protein product [Chrysoparadoxa australica]
MLLGEGKVTLCDFGLSIQIDDEPQAPLPIIVGTANYVSPEIFRNETWSFGIDCWALGTVLYTLLAGFHPFQHSDNAIMIKNIKKAKYTFKCAQFSSVSSSAKELIRGLLCKNTAERLTARDVLSHPWMVAGDDELARHELLTSQSALKLLIAKRRLRQTVKAVVATRRLSALSVAPPSDVGTTQPHSLSPMQSARALGAKLVRAASGYEPQVEGLDTVDETAPGAAAAEVEEDQQADTSQGAGRGAHYFRKEIRAAIMTSVLCRYLMTGATEPQVEDQEDQAETETEADAEVEVDAEAEVEVDAEAIGARSRRKRNSLIYLAKVAKGAERSSVRAANEQELPSQPITMTLPVACDGTEVPIKAGAGG